MDHRDTNFGGGSSGSVINGSGSNQYANYSRQNQHHRGQRQNRRVEYEADDRLYESQSTPIPHWSKRVLYGIGAPEPPPELFGDRFGGAESAQSPGEKVGFLSAENSADEFGGSVPQSDIAVAVSSSKRVAAAAAHSHGTADIAHALYASGPADDRRAASQALKLAAVFYLVPAVITIWGVVLLLKVSARTVEKDIETAWSEETDGAPEGGGRNLYLGDPQNSESWHWMRRTTRATPSSASQVPPPPIVLGGVVVLLMLSACIVAIVGRMQRTLWQRRRAAQSWSAVKSVDEDGDLTGSGSFV